MFGRNTIRSGLVVAALVGAIGAAVPAYAASSTCAKLEAALSNVGSGRGNSRLYEKYDAAVHRQQYELDRALRSARRLGCSGGDIFVFRSGGHPACAGVLDQVDRMRANLATLERKRSGYSGRGGSAAERRRIARELARNGCGDRGSKQREVSTGGNSPPAGGNYRTLCVRMCDGYYWPVRYAASPNRFDYDEQVCQAACPAAETKLFFHRNSGEEAEDMVSREGTPYTQIANAFRYREKFDAACTCGSGRRVELEALNASAEDQPTDTDAAAIAEAAAEAEQVRELTMAVPALKPEPGEDPDSYANRAGAYDPTDPPLLSTSPVAQKPAGEGGDGKRKVRIVGPSYSYVR